VAGEHAHQVAAELRHDREQQADAREREADVQYRHAMAVRERRARGAQRHAQEQEQERHRAHAVREPRQHHRALAPGERRELPERRGDARRDLLRQARVRLGHALEQQVEILHAQDDLLAGAREHRVVDEPRAAADRGAERRRGDRRCVPGRPAPGAGPRGRASP
jgi:hypothetical protein